MEVLHVKPFRFWCQKVLPLTYDDALSYYEVLCKCVYYINLILEEIEKIEEEINKILERLDKIEADIEYIKNQLIIILNKIEELEQRITSIEGDIINLQNRVTLIEGDINNLYENSIEVTYNANTETLVFSRVTREE